MCEIMFVIKNPPHIDPIIDAMDRYKVGDPVITQEDGHPWTPMESKQAWIAAGNDTADWHGITAILKLPGVAKAKADAMIDEDIIGDLRRARRRFGIKVDLVPNAVKLKIAQDGEFTTSVAAIKTYIRNKIDDAIYSGLD